MQKIVTFVKWAWESPTLTTWGTFFSRAFSLLAFTPILLVRFSPEEITVWYSLLTLVSFQRLADFGFSATFSRAIAFASVGIDSAEQLRSLRSAQSVQRDPSRPFMLKVLATMRRVYLLLSCIAVLALGIFGTASLVHPIHALDSQWDSWLAWGIALVCTFITFQGTFTASYLQGMNQIAILRRWETIWTTAGTVSCAIVAWYGGGILTIMCVNQGFSVFNVLWNLHIAKSVGNEILKESAKVPFDREIFDAIWPSAWRSGIGVLMSNGVLQATGLLYAQIGQPAMVASYLLAMRLINAVVQFSQAPFYSKIPSMARLYAKGDWDGVLRIAVRGMRLSYAVFLMGTVAIGVGAPLGIALIKSQTQFVAPSLWAILSLAFFIERCGAMNMQLYSLSNHILWHIANGITGAIYVVLAWLAAPWLGVWAFPLAMMIAYLACYTSYSILLAHRLFSLSSLRQEMHTGAIPTGAALLFASCIAFTVQMLGVVGSPQVARSDASPSVARPVVSMTSVGAGSQRFHLLPIRPPS